MKSEEPLSPLLFLNSSNPQSFTPSGFRRIAPTVEVRVRIAFSGEAADGATAADSQEQQRREKTPNRTSP